MGTSASSEGPGSGVPLVPPWVADPGGGETSEPPEKPEGDESDGDGDSASAPSLQIAPVGRFGGARRNLGNFASNGSGRSLRRGLAHYVRTGLGGTGRASQRLVGTARKSGALYGVLHALSQGRRYVEDDIDASSLVGGTVGETADRIAQAISPTDGSLDAEASRESVFKALSEFARNDTSVDLAALTDQQIEVVLELYISEDICRRVENDVGRSFLDRAPSPAVAIDRLNQMYRYVRQAVAAAFRRQRQDGLALSRREATRLTARVIRDTFTVFESYLP